MKTFLFGLLQLCLCALGQVAEVPAEDPKEEMVTAYDETMQQEIEHPREAEVLAVPQERTWSGGVIPFYIETNSTNPNHPVDYFLSSDDERVAAAIAQWEAQTCVRFINCGSAEGCANYPNYVVIISGNGCRVSDVGRAPLPGPQYITLRSSCYIVAVYHEIGHVIGLNHEHSRSDRDDHIRINYNLSEEDPVNFGIREERDAGAFNYASVMLYPFFLDLSRLQPEMEAPVPVLHGAGVSAGDEAAVDFMYNGCSEEYLAPTCMPSRAATVHLIPFGRSWRVMFSTSFTRGMPVSVLYLPELRALVAEGAATVSVAEGEVVPETGGVTVAIAPSCYHAGQIRSVGVVFVAAGSRGRVSTPCEVDVRVADAEEVCFNKSGTDPLVCSGHGVCTMASVPQPCECDEGYGGPDCTGTPACAFSRHFSFDTDALGIFIFGRGGVDTSLAAEGAASLRVTDVMTHDPQTLVKPVLLSMYLAPDTTQSLRVSVRHGRVRCLEFGVHPATGRGGLWWVRLANGSAVDIAGVEGAAERVFQHVEVQMTWGAGGEAQFALGVDGQQGDIELIGTSRCPHGFNRVLVFGSAWMDELALRCKHCTNGTVTLAPWRRLRGVAFAVTAPAAAHVTAGGVDAAYRPLTDLRDGMQVVQGGQAVLQGFNGTELHGVLYLQPPRRRLPAGPVTVSAADYAGRADQPLYVYAIAHPFGAWIASLSSSGWEEVHGSFSWQACPVCGRRSLAVYRYRLC